MTDIEQKALALVNRIAALEAENRDQHNDILNRIKRELDKADRIEALEAENERLRKTVGDRMEFYLNRIEALSAENERLIRDGDGDAGLIHWQGERIETLEAGLREVFEEWAGSEGFIPETAPEGYLLQLTKRMADIARAALGDTK